jgi:serine/threonine protein kinase
MLSDLGLGKSLAEVSRITLPGGTPAYVAPEQVLGERLDQRADLYSLGAVAYAAFTGQAPHGVASLGAVMQIEKPPPSMTTLREDVPDAIDVVVRRALEPNRDKRWPDLDSFLNALREAHTTGKVPPGLVPADEMPTPVPATGAVDQATALSGASQPTSAAEPTRTGQLTDAGQPASAAEPTQPPRSNQSTVATRPKRSARSWVIAVLVALLLAAAGGYGGYRYVLTRPVKVTTDHLSVDVPRSWSQKAVDPGKSLVVSTSTSTWQTNSDTQGVFVGLVASSTLPEGASAPPGCTAGTADRGQTADGVQIVTFQHSCGGHPPVVEQYRQVNDTTQLRIQVRGDTKERQAVLDSAAYTGP